MDPNLGNRRLLHQPSSITTHPKCTTSTTTIFTTRAEEEQDPPDKVTVGVRVTKSCSSARLTPSCSMACKDLVVVVAVLPARGGGSTTLSHCCTKATHPAGGPICCRTIIRSTSHPTRCKRRWRTTTPSTAPSCPGSTRYLRILGITTRAAGNARSAPFISFPSSMHPTRTFCRPSCPSKSIF